MALGLEVHIQTDTAMNTTSFFFVRRRVDGVLAAGTVHDGLLVFTEVEDGVRMEPTLRVSSELAHELIEALREAIHPAQPDLLGELLAVREALAVERVRVDRKLFPDEPYPMLTPMPMQGPPR